MWPSVKGHIQTSLPGRRDGKRLDPLQCILFGETGAVGAHVGESGSGLLAAYARTGVQDVTQASRAL